ncbi:unnamed protein product, partial [Laminaria digitata]
GTGRWLENSGVPGERFHPPELRETTCAVALKWLLRRGVDSPGHGGSGIDGGGGGGEREGAAERALKYRRCGRELFTRLLASGAPLRSVKVIKAAMGGVGAEDSGLTSLDTPEGSEDAPILWKQTTPAWGDPEKPSPGKQWKPLSGDWLVPSLPKDDAEREVAAQQALHVSTVVEAFLRTYVTCDRPGAHSLHSPTAVGLLQQGVSAACWADDPDLAARLFEAWLARADISKPSHERLRNALRISLSEVLTGFFAEGEGEYGVFQGLSLIRRCREVDLSPYPFDFLGAMRACNAAGLYSVALRLFDELTAAASADPYSDNDDDSESNSPLSSEFSSESDLTDSDSDSDLDSDFADSDSDSDFTDSVSDSDFTDSDSELDNGVVEGSRQPDRPQKQAVADSGERGEKEGGGGEEGEGGREGEDWGMRFVGLIDIPDGELIPAAAATIALESCFLGGSRDQAMEIVWQLIRQRRPLTEACRNRAIVALTEGGQPDMALDMARGMEIDDHYTDRATLEFVEKYQQRSFDAAAAAAAAAEAAQETAVGGHEQEREQEQEHDEEQEREQERDEEQEQKREEEQEQDEEQEDGEEHEEEHEENGGVFAGGMKAVVSSVVRGDGPSELVLRFLPLLSEALRNRLRPDEEDGGAIAIATAQSG